MPVEHHRVIPKSREVVNLGEFAVGIISWKALHSLHLDAIAGEFYIISEKAYELGVD